MSRIEGIVTPEAVRLEFAEATVGSRGAAVLLDWLVQGLALVTLSVALGFVLSESGVDATLPDWVEISLVLVLSFLIVFGYPTALETLWGGRTLGKAVFGLRVVTTEGAPVRFRHAAIRAALGLVDFALTWGVAAVVSSLVSRRRQRLGDMVAGTVVLRERIGVGQPTAASFAVPAGAEAYAQTLDPSGLRPRDYQTLRTFLLRAPELPEPSRNQIATDLARTLAARVGHRPPEGVTPQVFLQSLAARYQEGVPLPAASSPPAPGMLAPSEQREWSGVEQGTRAQPRAQREQHARVEQGAQGEQRVRAEQPSREDRLGPGDFAPPA